MFIDPAETSLVVIDLQERLAPAMAEFEACANRVELLLAHPPRRARSAVHGPAHGVSERTRVALNVCCAASVFRKQGGGLAS